MSGILATPLPDGWLRLDRGALTLLLGLDGTRAAMAEARRRATARFEEVLAGWQPNGAPPRPSSSGEPPALGERLSHRMAAAARPFRRHVVAPLAALGGALAEEILEAIIGLPGLDAAHASQGAATALFLAPAQVMRVGLPPALRTAMPEGLLRIATTDPVRGVATAERAATVTVLATSAAQAGAAASVIAEVAGNPEAAAPGHVEAALDAAESLAETLQQRGLIDGALLLLHGRTRRLGEPHLLPGC